MAFYKYGIAFLAGTGFGAMMTSVRREMCPLRKQQCRHRRRNADDMPETEERYEEHGRRQEKESNMGPSRRPKKGDKEKERDASYNMEESE
ncbi:hypothetical protein PR202_gb28767 [Eleusine coracana subsp. coracana]|uniref:Uncharacterized protein n=1 Tax=Eleusine coracana subsp. coracana TaxID=191504 RepID=A0AAV5FXS3_ELECO|nr:hypothetical protein PR202_gb28767 [Eleusine coracana subsp. coracana]